MQTCLQVHLLAFGLQNRYHALHYTHCEQQDNSNKITCRNWLTKICSQAQVVLIPTQLRYACSATYQNMLATMQHVLPTLPYPLRLRPCFLALLFWACTCRSHLGNHIKSQTPCTDYVGYVCQKSADMHEGVPTRPCAAQPGKLVGIPKASSQSLEEDLFKHPKKPCCHTVRLRCKGTWIMSTMVAQWLAYVPRHFEDTAPQSAP